MPGVQRARRRLGPGVAPDHRPARTATGGASRARRSGRPTPPWPSGASCWPGRRRARRSSRASRVFLVPMDRPGDRGPSDRHACSGPHHLNEVFFDDAVGDRCRRARPVDDGWSVVQEVLAFERVGHRPLRPVRAPAPVGARSARRHVGRPARASCASRWARMLTHCRRARLLAYRVVAAQSTGTVQARRRGRLPHRGDPARPGERRGARGHRGARPASRATRGRRVPASGGGPPAVLGVGHRRRREASRCSASCWPDRCWRPR